MTTSAPFAEPPQFKPADGGIASSGSWHARLAAEGAVKSGEEGDRRCAICNAKPGQPHLSTGRYPD